MESINKYNNSQLNLSYEIQQTIESENKKTKEKKENSLENSNSNYDVNLDDALKGVKKNYYEKLSKEEISKEEEKLKELNKRLSVNKTDEFKLSNEEFLLKNTGILKKDPILINILKDIGILESEINYFNELNFGEIAKNIEKLTRMEILTKIEENLDETINENKEKIKELRQRIKKYYISNKDLGERLKKDDILNYFKDFKIKIEKYDDVVKYLNDLRFRIVSTIKLFEKNSKKEENLNNINLKIFVITLKLKLKKFLERDARNLERLIYYMHSNYNFLKKQDEGILGFMGDLLNVYLKFAINSHENFLLGLPIKQEYLKILAKMEIKEKEKEKMEKKKRKIKYKSKEEEKEEKEKEREDKEKDKGIFEETLKMLNTKKKRFTPISSISNFI